MNGKKLISFRWWPHSDPPDPSKDLLNEYTQSVFQDFESYPRTEVDLADDDNKMILETKSSFLT